jgi:DNA-binding CsgD family transcriptional regulator/tetratricopeptide (TPR) repeat protein
MGSSATAGLHDLEQGRAAYAERRWAVAFKALCRADEASPLSAPDLCALAWSAQLVARFNDFTSAMERAHHAYLSGGDSPAAVRCAFWLGFVHGSRGDLGPAMGWAERAARVLGDRDGVERGYLMLPELVMSAMVGGWSDVHDRAGDAAAVGERFDDADLTTFARHWRGRALVRMKRTTEGFALLDEAMVSVASGELSPFVSGLVYCSMIEACQEVFDLRRSQEWTRALSAWCDAQPEMIPFSGQCLVHRAELLLLHGEWEEGLNEATRAAALAAQAGDRPAIAGAHYVLGEIHRLRGEHDDALHAYESAHREGRDPLPGMALLRLAQGGPAAGRATLQRACDESDDALARARLLPALVEILVATDAAPEARVACDELAATAASFGSTVLAAVAVGAAATVDLLDGDAARALAGLREAERVWRQLDAPYELARVQVLRSQACGALGDDDGAALDRTAARETFAKLGAAADLERVETLATAGSAPTLLSKRELDVLRLVTTGSTNKAIAAELVVSEKTVERHVSNILTKLGVPSRAAATAYAYEHELL